MITTSRLTAILPVQDATRAAAFYRESLGLKHAASLPDGSEVLELDTQDMIQLMKTPEGPTSGHTALSFEVDDIEAEMRELRDRGVHFEDYDLPGLKTVDQIADMDGEKAAWFLDPEGNVLCLHQRGPQQR